MTFMLRLCLQDSNNETYKKALEMTSKVSNLGCITSCIHLELQARSRSDPSGQDKAHCCSQASVDPC